MVPSPPLCDSARCELLDLYIFLRCRDARRTCVSPLLSPGGAAVRTPRCRWRWR
ncbi:unnamed protein product [Ectocarpus sp. CCAP 1310/34]|nr:unnamed protein product [Ectocarpus sp. CCAP 1310/34]